MEEGGGTESASPGLLGPELFLPHVAPGGLTDEDHLLQNLLHVCLLSFPSLASAGSWCPGEPWKL